MADGIGVKGYGDLSLNAGSSTPGSAPSSTDVRELVDSSRSRKILFN
jgi:hypothetical protein